MSLSVVWMNVPMGILFWLAYPDIQYDWLIWCVWCSFLRHNVCKESHTWISLYGFQFLWTLTICISAICSVVHSLKFINEFPTSWVYSRYLLFGIVVISHHADTKCYRAILGVKQSSSVAKPPCFDSILVRALPLSPPISTGLLP